MQPPVTADKPHPSLPDMARFAFWKEGVVYIRTESGCHRHHEIASLHLAARAMRDETIEVLELEGGFLEDAHGQLRDANLNLLS